jgi:magnesium transporter
MLQNLDKELVQNLENDLENGQEQKHKATFLDSHPADLAELVGEISLEAGQALFNQIPAALSAEVLMELNPDLRAEYLADYTGVEIATHLVENLDSDDAADLINELDDAVKKEVLSNLDDQKQAKDLARLLVYPEDTAGALMGTELIKVKDTWRVLQCVKEMRKQAEQIEQVHAIYVVNENNILLGTLSLKKLLTTSTQTPISEIYSQRVQSVEATADAEDVANTMQKYDLVVIPVVDTLGQLVGRITIDDALDFIRDEAKEDYNLASGLTDEVESSDTIWRITRARLPWLMIGLVGGLLAASVIGRYETDLELLPQMAFFIPLIAAMGGNVGVQSSAIIVQGLASQADMGNILGRLLKELGVGLVNGIILGITIIGAGLLLGYSTLLALTVAVALVSVIIAAALIGTFVPLLLDRYKIDPALATGPFITTLNDILGLFLYFQIGRWFL